MRKGMWLVAGLALLFAALPLLAQTGSDGVRLFQSYFFDSPIAKAPYGQVGLAYSDYEGASILQLGPQGGYPINDKIEVDAGLSYVSWSVDGGNGESGISDLELYGRYSVANKSPLKAAVGAMVTLPIGSDKVGYGNLNFGGFGALRYALKNGMVITGTAGLIFNETTTFETDLQTGHVQEKTSHESYVNLGGGVIYPVSSVLNVVGELVMRTEGDYMLLSGGADYKLGNGRLRGALGIGLDDGAPDLQLLAGYAISF
ncbi:MAG: hypothetical protein ONB30_04845 [candidate division KSB1 bacterium]|nr:hypothetical protein [candidate division KSB1 bacterium]